MLSIVIALFSGWLFHFIGLSHFFNILLGFDDKTYYGMWFILGCLVAIKRIFRKGEKK